MVDDEGFTTDCTQFCRTRRTTGTKYPAVWSSKSLGITEDRVHNGDSRGDAVHYGIRAQLTPFASCTPCYPRGVIYQIVESDTVVRYENHEVFTERIKYLEAWVVSSRKPRAFDYLTNERNGEQGHGVPLYTIGLRTINLTTWFVAGQNSTDLKQMGFSKDIEPANGLWGTLDVGVITPDPDAIRRRVEFEWDYINNHIDRMSSNMSR